VHRELLKLGFVVAETTAAKCMPRRQEPRSVTWRAFLMNHGFAARDFFTVTKAAAIVGGLHHRYTRKAA